MKQKKFGGEGIKIYKIIEGFMKILDLCPFPGSVLANTIATDGTPGPGHPFELGDLKTIAKAQPMGIFFKKNKSPHFATYRLFKG